MDILYIVVPCYNEEEVLPETEKQLVKIMETLVANGRIDPRSRILFVDDGSRDKTWEIIEGFSRKFTCGVKLSRNCGHQNALLAGLLTAADHSDCVLSLDADLQDDPQAIPEFVEKYQDGCEIVYGIRKSRGTDTKFKRGTAHAFYRFMRVMGVQVVDDHADYRLMSRRAVESLSQFREINLFLRGIVPLIGFKSGRVYYDRHERYAGKSKYPLGKMLSFALDGITSFTAVPLRFISALGFIISLASIAVLIYALVSKLVGSAAAGWTTLMGSIWFIGGVQLLCIGICGEYIGKIYGETKSRPRYFIEKYML